MSKSQAEEHYFITHLTLEKFNDGLKDIPKNKKLKKTVKYLSAVFRYKWEQEKARISLDFWRESVRTTILELRNKILTGRKKGKK